MIVVINRQAGAGAAMKRWNRIRPFIESRTSDLRVHVQSGGRSAAGEIAAELERGETDFVAAGGDGTVNVLLNTLLDVATPEQLRRVRLGAIGLGSSNDFHKPFRPGGLLGGIPAAVRFDQARRRDVGLLMFHDGRQTRTRHFLVNASVGFAASANRCFNVRGRFREALKRASRSGAILWAVLRTLVVWKNLEARVRCGAERVRKTSLTNLSVLKNPHVAGALRFGDAADYRSGSFRVYVMDSLTRSGLVKLLWGLRRGGLESCKSGTVCTDSSTVAVSASEPFAVEYDGEVVTATSCSFRVLPRYLLVCP